MRTYITALIAASALAQSTDLPRSHSLIELEADINITELEQTAKPVQSGYEDLGMLIGEYSAQLENLQQEWQPKFEQWWSEQERREIEAAQSVTTQLVDNVYIDGVPLRDMFGLPQDWMMARRVPGTHTNVYSLFALHQVVLQEDTVAHVHVSLPNEEEINSFLQQIARDAEEVAENFEEFADDIEDQLEDLMDDAESDVEEIVDDLFDNVINPVADEVKSTLYTNTTVSVNEEIIPISLSSKYPAKNSNGTTVAVVGASFGLIATLAVGAMVASCNKKKVAANQESLL